jgi:hypothetical protein
MGPTKRIKASNLSEKNRQWIWFAGLLAGGMAAMLLLAGLVRLILRIGM